MENSTLFNYFQNLRQRVKALAPENDGNDVVSFTKIVMADLSEKSYTYNPQGCDVTLSNPYSGSDKKRLNGYSWDREGISVDLFITHYLHDETNYGTATREALTEAGNECFDFLKAILNNDAGFMGALNSEPTVREFAADLHLQKSTLQEARIFILTNGTFTLPIKLPYNLGKVKITYEIFHLERLQSLKDVAIKVNFERNFGGELPCLPTELVSDYKTYLCLLRAETLVALYSEYKQRILEQNIRAFLALKDNPVNTGILETIENQPDRFLAYNNGIVATASEVTLNGEGNAIFTATDLQIVNGGQTTATLYFAKKKYGLDISKVYVQMKLSVIEQEEKRQEIVPNIARYANSQNQVSGTDFTSNHPFLIGLERIARNHRTQLGTYWFFERARGQYETAKMDELTPVQMEKFEKEHPVTQLFTKEDMAQYANCWAQKPYFLVQGVEKNYVQFIDGVPKDTVATGVIFEDLIAKAILFKKTTALYNNRKRPYAIGKLEKVTVPYSIAWLAHATSSQKKQLDLAKIWKLQTLSENLKAFLQQLMYRVEQFIKETAPTNKYKVWAASETCWEQMKTRAFMEVNELRNDLISFDELAARMVRPDENWPVKERNRRLQRLSSITIPVWNSIEKWGQETTELQPNQFEIIERFKLYVKNSSLLLTDNELNKGEKIVELVSQKAQHLFSPLNKLEKKDLTYKKVTMSIVDKVLKWDDKQKRLSYHNYLKLVKYKMADTELQDVDKQIIWSIIKPFEGKAFMLK